ncbi:helix-turn-helix domain-containing protein, partial [Halomonas sp. BC04]|uniref:helix-turn-helix domain-containing protein n=1 Tax=Halomonas sp. BC04 TaxID=1403540 RepID=UPI001E367576
LHDAVQSGRFRSDLFYRLSTISIQLPNIKDRTDFNDLARHILHKIDPNIELTNCGAHRLRQHDWPGNIRELRNFLTRLVVLNDGKNVTRKEVESTFEMEDSLGLSSTTETVKPLPKDSRERDIDHPSPASRDLCDTRKNRQRLLADQIQQSCERNLYNVSRVARELGVSRSTVYKYLKQ